MKVKAKKLILCVLLFIVSFFAISCKDCSVHVYETTTDEFNVPDADNFMIEIDLDASLVKAVEDSATVIGKEDETEEVAGNKWTIATYLQKYFSRIDVLLGTTSKYDGAYTFDDGTKTYRYYFAIPHKTEFYSETELKENYDIDYGVFINEITYTRANRIDYFANQLNMALSDFDSGKKVSEETNKLPMYLLIYGYKIYPNDTSSYYDVPPLNKAFKQVGFYYDDIQELKLFDYLILKDNMRTSGVKTDMGDYAYYTFETRVGLDADDITLQYIRANGLGWYALSVLIGVLAIAVVLIIIKVNSKPKKYKPQKEDYYPYDPFEEYNQNKIDPFEDYK